MISIPGSGIRWIDAEVHLFPAEWCTESWQPPHEERVLRRTIYEHPDREVALAGADINGLIAEMDRAGIHGSVIMGLPWLSPRLCDENNAAIAEAVKQHPDRLIGLGVLPPPDRVDPVHAVRTIHEEHGLSGVKVIPAWQDWRLDTSSMDDAYREMAERGLVLMPHTDHPYLPDEGFDAPHRLLNVARRFPDLKIAAPHLGGMLAGYGLYEPLREELNNILFIGTVPKTMPMIRWAVEAVGAGQVAFGTDFPFNPTHEQSSMLETVAAMGFSDADLKRIAGQNVLDFYGVEW